MLVLPRPLWIVCLNRKRLHLSEPNKQGAPADVALCGKPTEDRTGVPTKTTKVADSICQRCLKRSGYVDRDGKWLTNFEACADMLRNDLGLSPEDIRAIMVPLLEKRYQNSN
jgi:hypothetical protein